MFTGVVEIVIGGYDDDIGGDLCIVANGQSPSPGDITTVHNTGICIDPYQDILDIKDFTRPVNRPIRLFIASPIQNFLLEPEFERYMILIVRRLADEPEMR